MNEVRELKIKLKLMIYHWANLRDTEAVYTFTIMNWHLNLSQTWLKYNVTPIFAYSINTLSSVWYMYLSQSNTILRWRITWFNPLVRFTGVTSVQMFKFEIIRHSRFDLMLLFEIVDILFKYHSSNIRSKYLRNDCHIFFRSMKK